MNVVYMEYFILKSPVVNYKDMGLVKNDHELSVHHVKLLNDYTMKTTFLTFLWFGSREILLIEEQKLMLQIK